MKKLTLELIGTDRQNVFVPLFVVVGGTNFTYGLTSKQNMAHIYVGTVHGAVNIDIQFIYYEQDVSSNKPTTRDGECRPCQWSRPHLCTSKSL